MRLLEVQVNNGRSRACTAACYAGNPQTVDRCKCVCGGALHGIGAAVALAMEPERLNEIRESLPLQGHQMVQLRLGA